MHLHVRAGGHAEIIPIRSVSLYGWALCASVWKRVVCESRRGRRVLLCTPAPRIPGLGVVGQPLRSCLLPSQSVCKLLSWVLQGFCLVLFCFKITADFCGPLVSELVLLPRIPKKWVCPVACASGAPAGRGCDSECGIGWRALYGYIFVDTEILTNC